MIKQDLEAWHDAMVEALHATARLGLGIIIVLAELTIKLSTKAREQCQKQESHA